MAISYFEIEDTYKLKTENDPVKVSVKIGDGNGAGGYLTFLDLDLKGSNKEANMGNSSAIADKWTIVSATIPDVLEETNWTSITVYVKEGTSKPTTFGPYKRLLPAHLDTASYYIKILNTYEE